MSQLNLYPNASTIDAVNDELVIWTNSLSAVQNINRNTFLNLSSQPVGLTDSQTLTNKTLTSPTVSSPTLSGTLAGTYTIGGTPTFPASVTQNTVSQTLTNKTLTSPTITSPTITNATISADTLTGYTVSNTGTIYGIPVTTGVINTAGTINGASLVANSVTNASILTGNLYASKFYNPYKFSVYRAAALLSNSSLTVIAFDTKVYDTSNNIDVVTNKGRFTAPVNGFYWFGGVAGNTIIVGSQMGIVLYKNGSILKNGTILPSAIASGSFANIGTTVQLVAGDYVELAFIGSGGGSMGVGQNNSYFEGFLVSTT